MKNDNNEIELLEQIIELLKPISKLSDHYNNVIENEIIVQKCVFCNSVCTYKNTIDNIQPLCFSCNSKKGDKII